MKILRVNMSACSYSEEVLQVEKMTLGGRALTSSIVSEEVPPESDPLGPENKLIIANGLLAGTGATSSGRLSIGAKSPLTGGIKEANAGGIAADALAKLGYRGIILEGNSEKDCCYILCLDEDGLKFLDAAEFLGIGNYQLKDRLFEKFGKDYALITIGPAGEQKLYAAGISVTDLFDRPSRLAARGGLGAVMGSKGVKAILISKKGKYKLENMQTEAFKEARKRYNQHVAGSDRVQVLKKYGTASTVMQVQNLGALPTCNFTQGQFEGAEAISGEALYDLIEKRAGEGANSEPCMAGCVIQCSNVVPDSSGKELVAPLEYESICLLGSNLGIGNLDHISRLNWLCNDLGLDTIEVGGTFGVMAEAGVIPYNDFKACEDILKDVYQKGSMGTMLGMGSYKTGMDLGVKRIPTVKSQTMSAYDPRGVKGTGVTYATSTMGADHTAGLTVFFQINHHDKENQIAISKKAQIQRTGYDIFGLCNFLTSATGQKPELVLDMVNALYGLNLTPDDWNELAKDTLKTERDFNIRAGLGPQTDTVPDFFKKELLPPFNLKWDIEDEELQTIYND